MKNLKKTTILLAMVVAIISILTGCGSTTINIDDYISYEFDGLNGEGKFTYTLDDQSIYDKLVSNKVDEATAMFLTTAVADFTASPDKDLSNGDTVEISWTINNDAAKEYGVQYKASNKTLTVSGLKEPTIVDIFQSVTVAPIDNISCKQSGYGSVEITCADYPNYKFSASENILLSNGDTITITLSNPDEYKSSDCIVPENNSKEYTLDCFAEKLTDVSFVTDELFDTFASEIREDLDKPKFFGSNVKTSSLDLVDKYVAYCYKDDGKSIDGSYLFVVYKVSYEDGSSEYLGKYISDLYAFSDGTMLVDPNGKTWSMCTGLNDTYGSSIEDVESKLLVTPEGHCQFADDGTFIISK